MTDPQTPATEAGRLDAAYTKGGDLAVYAKGYEEGRADALREAAERVRALPHTGRTTGYAVERAAVLAILAGEVGS